MVRVGLRLRASRTGRCDCVRVERRRTDEKGTCVRVDNMVLDRAEEDQVRRGLAGLVAD